MNVFLFLIFQLAVLIFSVVLHEIAHGFMAERLGDPTARLAGRLTLNPIAHIDPFGSIILPILLVFSGSPILIGWAKPVPYNPLQLYKDHKYGPLKVALAGPLTNLFLLGIFGLLARIGLLFLPANLVALLGFIAYFNAVLAVFNVLPLPPLDGSKLLSLILPPRYNLLLERVNILGIFLVILFLYLFSDFLTSLINLLFFGVAGGAVFDLVLKL